MTEPEGALDEHIQQLLRETYEQVEASPAFKKKLYRKLARQVAMRRQSVGWPQRIRMQLADLAVSGWFLWQRRPVMTGIVVAVLLSLLVAGVVLAVRGGFDDFFQREPAPENQIPVTTRTPMAESLSSPTSIVTVDRRVDTPPATSQATPAEAEPSTIAPSSPAELIIVPTVTRPPTSTSTSVPTATQMPSLTPTFTPTATLMPASVQVTLGPTSQPTATSTVLSPPRNICGVARITGVAWIDFNGNSVRDAGDLPLAGVSLTLMTNSTGEVLRTVTTGEDGRYEFANLPAGRYRLQAVPPAGYEPNTTQAWGADLVCGTFQGGDLGYRYGAGD